MERGLLGLVTVSGEAREQVDEEVVGTAVARVLNLADVLELIEDGLNGLITNDKFCWSRPGQLRLSWPHYPLALRASTARRTNAPRASLPPSEHAHGGGSHETPLASAAYDTGVS
jgi:hypothetical protein